VPVAPGMTGLGGFSEHQVLAALLAEEIAGAEPALSPADDDGFHGIVHIRYNYA
jgi:hypothetical protein